MSRTPARDELPGSFNAEREFKTHERNVRLIEEHKGLVYKFRDLPVAAQCALVQYMAVDGEAWELPEGIDDYKAVREFRRKIKVYLESYVSQYGDIEFGYVELPTTALIESIMQDHEISEDWEAFDEYHKWYMRGNTKHPHSPKHEAKDLWPVILSPFEHETLQDGWTRFHQYVERGEESCPALFYLNRSVLVED